MQLKLETPEHQRTAIRRVVETILWPPLGDTEISRRCDGNLKEVYASGNVGGMAYEAGFVASQTHQGLMNVCSFLRATNCPLELLTDSQIDKKQDARQVLCIII